MLAGAAAAAALWGAAPAGAQTVPEGAVMSFERLAVLEEKAEGLYEGWAIVGGAPVSTGVFNVDAGGQPVHPAGGGPIEEFMAAADIHLATAIVITLEPPDDPDPAPSSIKLLAGAVVNAAAELRVNVPGRETLETATTGVFRLATPSDDEVYPDNDDMGIWFLSLPGPAAGFGNLPDLGADWRYEGWVVDTSPASGSPVPWSTGTFLAAKGADSDHAGCAGGGPPFPGQDFTPFHCGPSLDLDGGGFVVVITVEPSPDNSPAPFQLKPLAGPVAEDALGRDNPLANQAAATFPVGSARLYMGPTAAGAVSWGELKAAAR